MTEITLVGRKVPDFSATATGTRPFCLSDYRGQALVIFFYPKDNTPGCTAEAAQFAHLFSEFSRKHCAIVGVSRDSVISHENFKRQLELPFELISDSDETVCRLFDVIREKMLYGKKVLGLQRSTFLIDKTGVVSREWRNVKADGHAAEVLAALHP